MRSESNRATAQRAINQPPPPHRVRAAAAFAVAELRHAGEGCGKPGTRKARLDRRNTPNAERGTSNVERGTWNAERGTRHPARGTTLIELALVLAVSLLIASALISLLNVHFRMIAMSAQYRFLSQQAPQLGLLLTKTLGNADDFRIYGSAGDAMTDKNRVLTGPAVRLWMREPGGSPRTAVLSYAGAGASKGLYFYLADTTGAFPARPSWKMPSGDLTNATFDDSSGILRVTLQGSNHDQITFAAEKK